MLLIIQDQLSVLFHINSDFSITCIHIPFVNMIINLKLSHSILDPVVRSFVSEIKGCFIIKKIAEFSRYSKTCIKKPPTRTKLYKELVVI